VRLTAAAAATIGAYPPEVQVILTALRKYGMFVADNGSSWYISGEPSSLWNDDNLSKIKGIKGSSFEVVKTGTITPE
jgi:hypothetical protein